MREVQNSNSDSARPRKHSEIKSDLGARIESRILQRGTGQCRALKSVYGVDSMLIEDGTYFVAEADDIIVGCGGWSKRKTLFGGDQFSSRDASLLDPRFEAAKIRAFFIHPNFARRGIGRAILDRCEAEAARTGFISLELMSTLPGVEFYRARDYVATDPILYDAAGVVLEFVPMKKMLSQ